MSGRREYFAGAIAVWYLLAALPAGAQETTIRITRADCAGLVVPSTELGTAYTPGVDVRGRTVAPADLEDRGGIEIPPDIVVALEVDLVEHSSDPQSLEDLIAKAPIGEIELRGGKAYFNGRPLDSETEANLRVRCREALNGGG